MTGDLTLAYSPGYQVPLWLGPAQYRLWRRLDRVIGGRTFAATTVRALARELGANPGTISRDLDALARLGFAVHHAEWGRLGVRLWRVVSRGGRRGLDPARQRRALARMGVRSASPGQLALTEATSDHRRGPTPPTGSAHDAAHVAPALSPHPASAGTVRGASPADSPPPAGDAAPFQTERCPCGAPRLVMAGREPSPCPHPARRETVFGDE